MSKLSELLVTRIPFAPRVSAEATCVLAVAGAGLACAPVVTAALHAIDTIYWRVTTERVAPWTFLAAAVLALFSIRRNVRARRWLIGGAIAGLGACAGTWLTLGVLYGCFIGAPLDLLLGAGFGLLFGLACVLPAHELATARRDASHSARDVQIVNTSAWLCAVSVPAAMVEPSVAGASFAVVLALGAVFSAGFAGSRFALRRHWLRRVVRGGDPSWTTEAPNGSAECLPALELLPSWGDERAVVCVDAARGSAYRAAERRRPVARIVPARLV